MKYIFLFLVFIPTLNFSQSTLEKQLDTISTSEEAVRFLKENKPEDGKLITFNRARHKTTLANSLFQYRVGGKKVVKTGFKKTIYKIIDKGMVDFYKFNIIVLDGNKTSNQQAKVLRNKVLAQYKEGYQFKDLAKYHSDGPTAKTGGDTGWIKPGDMNSEAFDAEAFSQNHTVNDVFIVDDEINKMYYIVMKTQSKTPIEEITVLKFTEDLN